jgi:hypothetical protein
MTTEPSSQPVAESVVSATAAMGSCYQVLDASGTSGPPLRWRPDSLPEGGVDRSARWRRLACGHIHGPSKRTAPAKHDDLPCWFLARQGANASEQPLAGGRSWGLRSALDLRVEGGGGPLVISPPPGGAIGAYRVGALGRAGPSGSAGCGPPREAGGHCPGHGSRAGEPEQGGHQPRRSPSRSTRAHLEDSCLPCHRRSWNHCGSSSLPCCALARFTTRSAATARASPTGSSSTNSSRSWSLLRLPPHRRSDLLGDHPPPPPR